MIQRNTVEAAGWHRVSPTPSYSIELPADCTEDIDDGVYSYFRADDASGLQISSYRRTSGEQASARERLLARIARGSSMVLKPTQVSLPYDDYAAARGTDDESVSWLYVYVTWPGLTLFITISGTKDAILAERSWTRRALVSILPGG